MTAAALLQADYEICAYRLKGWVAEIVDALLAVLKERQRELSSIR